MCKNNKQILFCFLIFLALALWALFCFPLLGHYLNSSSTYLSFRNFTFYQFLTLVLLLTWVIYCYLDQKLIKNPPSLAIILGALATLSLISIFVFPIGASDIFLYLFQARTFAIHGLSPYTVAYSQLSTDIFYPFLKDNHWAGYTSSYGPLFTLITSSLALVFKSNLLASLLLFKGFLALIHLTNTWLIDKALGRRPAWLYAFNPLILFEFLINGHNEVLMIFFCLLAFYFLWQKYPNIKNSLFSIGFLTLGILTKFIPLILLPIWGLALLWRLTEKKEKIIFSLLALPLVISLAILAYWPFGLEMSTILTPIANQMSFFNPLLSSPVITFIYSLLIATGINNPWGVATIISRLLFLGFSLLLGLKIIQHWREKNIVDLLGYGPLIMLAFYASFFSWLMPWYFTFLLLLLLISYSLNNRLRYLIAFHFITIIGLGYYIILR